MRCQGLLCGMHLSRLFLPGSNPHATQPGEHVYALVYIPEFQLSGWVEAVIIEKEAMPGTVSVYCGQSWAGTK